MSRTFLAYARMHARMHELKRRIQALKKLEDVLGKRAEGLPRGGPKKKGPKRKRAKPRRQGRTR